MLPFHAVIVELFARGGGGGSSSGGGDGGGIIVLIGYLPMHFIGALIRRFTIKPGKEVVDGLLQIVGWGIAILYSFTLIFLLHGIGFLIAAGAFVGMGAGLYNWFAKIKQGKHVKNALQTAAQTDAAWDEARLTEFGKNTFLRFQSDWSAMNTEAMKQYLTPSYQYHNALLLYALQLLGRTNRMENVKISDAAITNLTDHADNSKDAFTLGISAQAHDQLIDTRENKALFIDDGSFTEYWDFVRNGETWLLNGIRQASASDVYYNAQMEAFAHANGYYYSADMGWLFIPARGQFFGDAKFGTSDINNHLIGVHNQTLVQLYTYRPNITSTKSYLIAQMNLPSKSYGQIVVRRKKAMQLFGIRGLERVETEWLQFNNTYEVFASAGEGVTSFELLNPRYMEQLAAAPFEVNIEVVDNVVYFYSDEGKADVANYQAMLNLLQLAFQEMRL